MKKIEAIIRKTKFEDVKEALLAADIEWFSYYDVRGEGKMRQARIYRGVMYDTSSIERVLLNVVVRDKNVEKTINAIQEAARTGWIDKSVSSNSHLAGPFTRMSPRSGSPLPVRMLFHQEVAEATSLSIMLSRRNSI